MNATNPMMTALKFAGRAAEIAIFRITDPIVIPARAIGMFSNDKSRAGATAIEYGLIAAGISLAIIAVVNGLGTKLNGKFDSIKTQPPMQQTR